MKKAILLPLILGSLAVQQAVADFSGAFDQINWILTNDNADGSVDTAGTPNFIILTGGNNGSEGPGSTSYTIMPGTNGMVSFAWSYTTDDESPSWDPFGYIQNGNFVQVSNSGGSNNQGGFTSFPIDAGQTMGFAVNTGDNLFGPGHVTVSEFNFVPSGVEIPFGVDSTVGLAVLGLASAWKLRRRKA